VINWKQDQQKEKEKKPSRIKGRKFDRGLDLLSLAHFKPASYLAV
jgi:hypothetical protein